MKQILVDVEKCLGCKSCELACAVNKSESKNLFVALSQVPKPVPRVFVEAGDGFSLPVQCRHCEDAKCIQACMSGAMQKDTSGAVTNNPEKCVGCWMCVMVCPFGAIIQDNNKLATKCDRCAGLESPACVQACPTKALQYIDIDDYSRSGRKKFLTNFKNAREV